MPSPSWSTTPPSEPGLYWAIWRDDDSVIWSGHGSPDLVELVGDGFIAVMGSEWVGGVTSVALWWPVAIVPPEVPVPKESRL